MIDIQHFSKPFATDTWHFIAGNGFVPGAYNAFFDQIAPVVDKKTIIHSDKHISWVLYMSPIIL